jgi:3-hydroxyacyl-[acyl-carrier-protein] dehydratase
MIASEEIFKIENIEHVDGVIKATLSINANSPIFKGHFPGQPVVPGACMLQVVKDVLADALGYAIGLKKGDNLKFVGMIVPGGADVVFLEISYKLIEDSVNVNAKLSEGDRVCFKFQGTFLNLDFSPIVGF